MKYHEADKKDKNLRQAIWEAYEGKCAYCKKNLLLTQMDIDHIIPSKPDLQDDETKQMIEELLKKGFVYDSLENFAPVHSNENKEKSNKVWSPTELLIPKNTAKSKIEEILALKEKYDNQLKACKKLPDLRRYISGNSKLAEEFYDDLMSQENFEDRDEYIKGNEFDYWKRSIKRVSLYATIPNVWNKEISCMFNFRALGIREGLITLGQEEILKLLFSGVNTKENFINRNFIIGAKDDNYSFVQIGNCRFPMKNDELNELCKIVDELFEKYIISLSQLEENIGSKPFKYSKQINGYKLLSIERSIWNRLFEFSWEYDWDNGKSEWHIFNKTNGFIQVTLDRGENINVKLKPVFNEKYVDIYWQEGFGRSFSHNSLSFNNKAKWKVDFTYDWIIRILIPYVLYQEHKTSKLFASFTSFEKYKRETLNFTVYNDFFQQCNLSTIQNKHELIEYMNMMLINLYKLEDTIFIDREARKSLIAFIERNLTIFCDFNIPQVKTFIDINDEFIKDNDSVITNIRLKVENVKDNLISKFLLVRIFETLLYIDCNSEIEVEQKQLEVLVKGIEKFDSFMAIRFLAKKYI